MATLSDVARLAGVTTATVSNVLRNPHKVKAATVQRVQQAIASAGYRPNLMARALSEGKSSMLALVLPDIVNPFYPEFVRVAERVARQRNYFLMVCNTDERPEIGRAYLQQIAGTLADGVLLLHAGIGAGDIRALKTRHAPIVLASEEEVDLREPVPHVVVNFQRAGEIAAEHLLQLGHRQIGVILGKGLEGLQVGRFTGFAAGLGRAGLVLAPQHICSTPDSIPHGYDAALTLLEANPGLSALFATNDLMAYGAAHALADRGIRVPQEVSLIGITDIQLARHMRPALTTVALGLEALATLSVTLLLDLIANPAHVPRIVQVPEPQLVLRQSTGPARPAATIGA